MKRKHKPIFGRLWFWLLMLMAWYLLWKDLTYRDFQCPCWNSDQIIRALEIWDCWRFIKLIFLYKFAWMIFSSTHFCCRVFHIRPVERWAFFFFLRIFFCPGDVLTQLKSWFWTLVFINSKVWAMYMFRWYEWLKHQYCICHLPI